MDSTTDTGCSQIMQKSKEKGRKIIVHLLIMTAVFLIRENPWKPRPKSAEFGDTGGKHESPLSGQSEEAGEKARFDFNQK